jgi:hypothetical protein
MAESKSPKKNNYLLIGGILFAVIVISKFCGTEEEKPNPTDRFSQAESIEEKKPVDSTVIIFDQKVFIEKGIDIINSGFPASDYKTKDGILLRIADYEAAALRIYESRRFNDTGVIRLKKELEMKLIAAQKKELPVLRKNYIKWANSEAWENDMKVSGTGTTINFTWAGFAANKNIKKFQEGVYELLYKLRFKTVNYRWYQGASEYTYYKIDSKKDDEF